MRRRLLSITLVASARLKVEPVWTQTPDKCWNRRVFTTMPTKHANSEIDRHCYPLEHHRFTKHMALWRPQIMTLYVIRYVRSF